MKNFLLLIMLIPVIWLQAEGQDINREKIRLITNQGVIILELYNETPQHRDNFVKLVNEGFYDGQLFHRVIRNFMIQGGDPSSKGAEPGQRLGSGGPGYTIPAEFDSRFFHKKGALSAARQGDNVNPEKQSSGSQFYIVQGTRYTSGKLDTLEMQMNYNLQQSILQKYMTSEIQEELQKYQEEGKIEELNQKVQEIQAEINSEYESNMIRIPQDKRETYQNIGGYPPLDGEYTVFGEVVEGLDVLDRIASVETDQYDRPLKDVIIEKAEVIK